ncbi:MAG TPA: zf-HC2 domain-containing protein [Candidatus Acidoferrales bacterium]|nr:zf-HC2 domain-containing protein [Candidatus Acidoferrales bacterium]
MPMMDCKEVLSNLSNYVDNDASAELRTAIEQHIGRCRRCRVVFDTTERALKMVIDVEPFEVPLAVSARLYTKLEKLLSGA